MNTLISNWGRVLVQTKRTRCLEYCAIRFEITTLRRPKIGQDREARQRHVGNRLVVSRGHLAQGADLAPFLGTALHSSAGMYWYIIQLDLATLTCGL